MPNQMEYELELKEMVETDPRGSYFYFFVPDCNDYLITYLNEFIFVNEANCHENCRCFKSVQKSALSKILDKLA